MSPFGRRRLDYSLSPSPSEGADFSNLPVFGRVSSNLPVGTASASPSAGTTPGTPSIAFEKENQSPRAHPVEEGRPCKTFNQPLSCPTEELTAVSLSTLPGMALGEKEKDRESDLLSTRRESNMPTERGPHCWSDVVSIEEIDNVSRLLRCNGMQSLNMSIRGSAITLSQKDVLSRMTDMLRLYNERGATIEELITRSRRPETELVTKNTNLAHLNKDLQQKLGISQKQLNKAQDAEALRMKWDSEKRAFEQQLGDLQLKLKGMEALLKAKDRDMEKLKAKLDRCIQQDRRRPEKEQKLDSLYDETVSLTRQLFLLSKEKEVKDREVDKLRKQLILQPKSEAPTPMIDDSALTGESVVELRALDRRRIRELEARLERECALREATETQLLEQKRALEFELKNMWEEVQCARDRERHRPVDQALLEEVQRLRDGEVEARRRWKSLDAKGLMRRDREMKKLHLLTTDFGLSRDEAVDFIKAIMHKINLDASLLDELLPRIDQLIASRRKEVEAIDVECQTIEAPDTSSSMTEILDSLKADGAAKALGRIETLKTHAAVLSSIGSRVGARRPNEVLPGVDRLLKACDEQLAARKIVDSLQSFFQVNSMELILPSLKDELSRQQALGGS